MAGPRLFSKILFGLHRSGVIGWAGILALYPGWIHHHVAGVFVAMPDDCGGGSDFSKGRFHTDRHHKIVLYHLVDAKQPEIGHQAGFIDL